jgi:hypothetical protein
VKNKKQTGILFLILLSLITTLNVNSQEDDLNVVRNSWLEFTDAQNGLYHYFAGLAYGLLKKRADRISMIGDLDGWKKRQEEIRHILMDITGPFPDKTPLNPRITKIVDKGEYRIENIIFESQPGFYVTSSLFIPSGIKGRTTAPAVIYCSGHSADGYRSVIYQHVILNLVKKGFIVFAFDPVGQGERLEYFDASEGKSVIGGPTSEHSFPGAQAFITGSSQAMYMVWDGIRAVDYLLTRKEVDPSRIGITGRSGGGTQSAYISAFDERILAAAPENYLTNYTRLLQSIGPQDAEQNLFNIVYRGLDHPDFLIVRAPKPVLMITTTRDMFSIEGARETEKEVSAIYSMYGLKENFSRAEDDAGHESTKKNREALYAFFQKFLDNPGDPADEPTQPLTGGELQVTETGQVSTSLTGETVFSLNLRMAGECERKLDSMRNTGREYIPGIIASAARLSGYTEPNSISGPVLTGRIIRNTCIIEKYFIRGEEDLVIPYLLFIPHNRTEKALIYLNPSGKEAEAGKGGEIEKIVNSGITVLAPDLEGYGETGSGALRGDAYFKGVSHNLWYASMLVKKSITGLQATEISRLVTILYDNLSKRDISALAKKELCPALLHAAVFDKRIKNIILAEPYSSYHSIVKNRFYDPALIPGTVPGALKEYDLPDLASALAPRRLVIAAATDSQGSRRDRSGIERDQQIIINGYHGINAENELKITDETDTGLILKLLSDPY